MPLARKGQKKPPDWSALLRWRPRSWSSGCTCENKGKEYETSSNEARLTHWLNYAEHC